MGFSFNMTPRLFFFALALILVLQVLTFFIGFKLGGMSLIESGPPKGRLVMPDGGRSPSSTNGGAMESSGGGAANHSPSEGSGTGQMNYPKRQN